MNWLLIIVALLFVIGIIVGFAKGAIRIAVSLAATIFTFLVVYFVTPYVSQALYSLTPADEMIKQQCLSMMNRMVTGEEEIQGLTEEQVRSMLAGAGVSEETLAAAGITVQDIVDGKVSGSDLAQYGISAGVLDGQGHLSEEAKQSLLDAEIPKQTQIEAIEKAPLPDFLKDLLLSNNNQEVYDSLGVTTFAEYISTYVTKLIIDILAFLVTFLVVTIVVRAIVFALDFVNDLPLLGILNRLAGAGVGIVIVCIIVNFLFLGIMLLYPTAIGQTMAGMIEENAFLTFLNEHNYVLKMATVFRV